MQIISSQVPYVGKSRNAEHDYLFNKYVDTDTLVQKDNARDNLFRRLKLHLQSAELDPDADLAAAAARCLEAVGSQNRRTRRPCPTPKTPPPCATSSTSWSPTTTPRR